MTTYPDVTPDWDIPLLKGNLTNDWRQLNDAFLVVDGAITASIAAHVEADNPHPVYLTVAELPAALTGITSPALTDPIVRDTINWGAKPSGAGDTSLYRRAPGALSVNPSGQGSLDASQFQIADALAASKLLGYFAGRPPSGTNARWQVGIPPGTTEPGGNVGSDYAINRYADNGAFLGAPVTVNRGTGTVSLSPDLNQDALRVTGPIRITPGTATNAVFFGDQISTTAFFTLFSQGSNFFVNSPTANRVQINPQGTFAVTPDAGQPALTWAGGGQLTLVSNQPTIAGPGGLYTYVHNSIALTASADNTTSLGWSDRRWATVFAVAGTINTSSADAKQDLTPLDPARGMAAVRNTTPVRFTYRAPKPTAPVRDPKRPYDWREARSRQLTEAPMRAARTQHGFVLDDPTYPCDPAFETGRGQSSPQNSVGLLLAAIQDLDTRLSTLEGAA